MRSLLQMTLMLLTATSIARCGDVVGLNDLLVISVEATADVYDRGSSLPVRVSVTNIADDELAMSLHGPSCPGIAFTVIAEQTVANGAPNPDQHAALADSIGVGRTSLRSIPSKSTLTFRVPLRKYATIPSGETTLEWDLSGFYVLSRRENEPIGFGGLGKLKILVSQESNKEVMDSANQALVAGIRGSIIDSHESAARVDEMIQEVLYADGGSHLAYAKVMFSNRVVCDFHGGKIVDIFRVRYPNEVSDLANVALSVADVGSHGLVRASLSALTEHSQMGDEATLLRLLQSSNIITQTACLEHVSSLLKAASPQAPVKLSDTLLDGVRRLASQQSPAVQKLVRSILEASAR